MSDFYFGKLSINSQVPTLIVANDLSHQKNFTSHAVYRGRCTMTRRSLIYLCRAFAATIVIALCATFSFVAGETVVMERTLQTFTPINVTSPRYPSNYPNNVDQAWHITAPPGFRLIARTGFIELERNRDFLRFGDARGQELIQLTGQGAPPSILSPANVLWMNFTSDDSSMAKGFQVEISLYNATGVRLVGGTTPFNGRVEVHLGGSEWGTVSSNEWNFKDAATVCKELGLPGAISAVTNAYYGEGQGTVWATQVDCNSDHFLLESCPSVRPCQACPHSLDAGANCHRPNYLGCFVLPNVEGSVTKQSIEECIMFCDQNNRRYSVQSGDRCSCLNAITFPDTAEEDSLCNQPCPGNANEACGGLSSTALYSIHDTQFATCPDPGVPGNATRTGSSFQMGSKVQYTCSAGFDLVGNWELTCLPGEDFQNPEWNSTLPVCIAQIDNSTMPTNTTVIPQPQTSNDNTIVIVIVIVIVCIFSAIIFLICFCRCRRHGRCRRKAPKEEMWY